MAAGVYLHIPFCKSRCSYCDFATDVYRNNDAVERYVSALCGEIDKFSVPDVSKGETSIDTVYFGGGTPSMLAPEQIDKILLAVDRAFSVESNSEITMEMNPATVTPASLRQYKSLGINRASFGVQTFDDRALKLLARGHDANDARQTFAMLREAGFDNISFDLIAGLPVQSLDDWNRNLDESITLDPEHLSLYLLEIHEGTPLAEQIKSGRQPLPDDDLAVHMYQLMCDKLAGAGYAQYEISNFAKMGFESRHNSKYWRLEQVYGFGVSAHSFDGTQRYANERDTAKYVEMIEMGSGAEVMREVIDQASEYIFLGLRMNEGINLAKFHERFGVDITERYSSDLYELEELDLIRKSMNRLHLTPAGMLYSNEVFARFV